MENYCENPAAPACAAVGGLGLDGGMAEYVFVPAARLLVPLPEGLDPARGAAHRRRADAVPCDPPVLVEAGPDGTAVVIGVGGLGHVAVQILKATTAARVIAVDNREEALGLAEGRRRPRDRDFRAADAAEDLARGLGADVVLDFVGADATLGSPAPPPARWVT